MSGNSSLAHTVAGCKHPAHTAAGSAPRTHFANMIVPPRRRDAVHAIVSPGTPIDP